MRLQYFIVPLCLIGMSTSILAAPPSYPIETIITNDSSNPVPVTGDVAIVADALNPVPITGDVTAVVTGDVDVSGSVEVTSVPDTLTDQIDSLIEKVEAIDGEREPANYVRHKRVDVDSRDSWAVNLDTPVKASLITVSAENDKMVVHFCSTGAGDCSVMFAGEGAAISLGSSGQTFPSVVTIPLTQPVVITGYKIACLNLAEDCEVLISIVGTVPE